jgi:hypothetical protein
VKLEISTDFLIHIIYAHTLDCLMEYLVEAVPAAPYHSPQSNIIGSAIMSTDTAKITVIIETCFIACLVENK